MIEDHTEAGDDDYPPERSHGDDDDVPKNVEDVWQNKPGLESDLPKKIQKVGAPDSCETKKSDGPATENDVKDHNCNVEHEAQSGLSRSSFDRLRTQFRCSSQLNMRKRIWWLKMATSNRFSMRTDHHGCAQGVFFKDRRRYQRF